MPVAITNLTSRPIFVPLNSGPNLRLSSGEVATPILDVELINNSEIDNLISQRAIAVENLAEAPEADSPVRARKKG